MGHPRLWTTVARRQPSRYPLPVFVLGRRLAVTLAVVAAMAAGCGGHAGRPRSLPPISSTSAAAATSAAPHSRADDLAAVKAVVRKYYALLGASTSYETAIRLGQLVTRDCKCMAAADAFRRAARAHQHYFGHVNIRNLVANIDGRSQADALVVYDYTRAGLRNA